LRNKLFIIIKHGLAAASRLNNTKEIEDYIELTFRKSSFFDHKLSVCLDLNINKLKIEIMTTLKFITSNLLQKQAKDY
jgi:hypothetical protein